MTLDTGYLNYGYDSENSRFLPYDELTDCTNPIPFSFDSMNQPIALGTVETHLNSA